MAIFRRRPPDDAPPPGLNEHHDFAGSPADQTPGGIVPYIPTGNRMLGGSGGVGLAGWAPRAGIEMPAIADQDAILTHWTDEPGNNPVSKTGGGDPYYTSRNQDTIARRNRDEYLSVPVNGAGYAIDSHENPYARNPNWNPPVPSRPTAFQSPSSYRFLHNMRSGHGDVRHLSGEHFSMAAMGRTYPVRGMQPARRFRNTWRLEPTPRDEAVTDVVGPITSDPSGQYVSPNMSTAPTAGGSWRLQ